MPFVHAGKLLFEISDTAADARFSAGEFGCASPAHTDFFRLHLDDGMQRDLTVHACDQRGVVSGSDDDLVITYRSLVAEDGTEYPITLQLHMKTVGVTMECYAVVENHADIRVNEVQFPMVPLSFIADRERTRDTLYWPCGLGQRIRNPWAWVQKGHSGYMTADYDTVWQTSTYPFPLSMAWYGIESAGHFLYLGRHDPQNRTCSLSLGGAPLHVAPYLIPSVSHYPVVNRGETITCGKSVISLLAGSWREGAEIYRAYARSWYHPPKPVEWVRNMSGWQRIIMKHQYGKVFFRYPDLVRLYEEGARYGLDTLLVFGWWRGRFDNGYPKYEPDEALGGAEALRRAIADIHARGGHVILYNNGVLIDVTGDFYRGGGYRCTKKNIDGAEYREFYRFAGNGMMLRTFGYKSFSSACHGTDAWKEKLIENAKIKLAFDPDSLFFDQLGGHLPRFCFDSSHKHGCRCDMDLCYKQENVSAIRAILPEGKCIGTENVVDVLAPYFDYAHGCENAWYAKDSFPSLYRSLFPETVVTNRFSHDDGVHYRTQLNFAFVNGLRFDVSIYRGREIGVAGLPNYAAYLRYLLALKQEYRAYFYDGTFLGEDRTVAAPDGVTANLFRAQDGRLLLVLWNDTPADCTVEAHGGIYTLAPDEFYLVELPAEKS